jgi:hypothetical protein
MVKRTLEHIDKKRAALKLPVYDSERHGESGDKPIEEYLALPADEQMAQLYG